MKIINKFYSPRNCFVKATQSYKNLLKLALKMFCEFQPRLFYNKKNSLIAKNSPRLKPNYKFWPLCVQLESPLK
jgi:hypothetical protein